MSENMRDMESGIPTDFTTPSSVAASVVAASNIIAALGAPGRPWGQGSFRRGLPGPGRAC